MSIFISYKTDDGSEIASSIYGQLRQNYEVFLDRESLGRGRFDEEIKRQIERCSDFIVIVTPRLLESYSHPDQWVSREASIALKTKRIIIPVFATSRETPTSAPKLQEEVLSYQGVHIDSPQFYQKLERLLSSSKRLELSIVRSERGAVIDAASREGLKLLQRNFDEHGRHPVDDIKLTIGNPDDLASLYLELYDTTGAAQKTERAVAKQHLLTSLDYFSGPMRAAISYMLQDEAIDPLAEHLAKHYGDRASTVDDCYYVDNRGKIIWWWRAFLWADIVDELLKLLKRPRQQFYGDSALVIDCYCQDPSNGSTLWCFTSALPSPADPEERLRLTTKLALQSDYYDIPPQYLAFSIYPDFYYSIAMLKLGNLLRNPNEFVNHPDVFNLANYRFGLH